VAPSGRPASAPSGPPEVPDQGARDVTRAESLIIQSRAFRKR